MDTARDEETPGERMKLHRCDNCGKDRLGEEKDKFWFELSRLPEMIIPSDAPVLLKKPRPPGKEFCSSRCVVGYCQARYPQGKESTSRIGEKKEESPHAILKDLDDDGGWHRLPRMP